MDKKTAIELTGGLSKTTKMPGPSYGLPATACKTGSKLRKQPGSVCSKCYGRKGHYPRPVVRKAQERRLRALRNGKKWVEGMVYLIKESGCVYFRFHDTGDIQSLRHLRMICKVCECTPKTHHRLPTKEWKIVKKYMKKYELPSNLTIRASADFIGAPPPEINGLPTSTVGTNKGFLCPATRSRHICGSCRACWKREVKNVDYALH
jgi:hypothetical protein